MVPTLRDGDVVLVRHGAAIRPGDVVLARFRSMPDRLVLKRAVRARRRRLVARLRQPVAGGDSASHGVADVLGASWSLAAGVGAPWPGAS